jgi:hypothetical protein
MLHLNLRLHTLSYLSLFVYLFLSNQASRSVLRAAHEIAVEDASNNFVNESGPTRAEFLAARRGGRKWRAWELEALQSAVRAFR